MKLLRFHRSVGFRFAFGTLALAVLFLGPVLAYFDLKGEDRDVAALESSGRHLLAQLARTLEFDLLLEDVPRIEEELRFLDGVPLVATLQVLDREGRPLVSWRRDGARSVRPRSLQQAVVGEDGAPIGSLVLELEDSSLAVLDAHRHWTNLAIALGVLLAAGFPGLALGLLLNRRLKHIAQASYRISRGDLDTRAQLRGRDEVAVLAGAFNDMADRIQERELELVGARSEAEQQAEHAKRAEQAKSRFLATMSHEIRTPMNGVLGMADLLLGTPLNDEQQDLATTLRDSGRSLLGILNDILDFSKVEAGHLELEEVEFDLCALLESVAELFAPKAQRPGLVLDTCLRPELPLLVRGDPGRLRQVVANLLGNAIKFTEAGSVVLRSRVVEQSDGQATVRIGVKDTGWGIPADVRGRLFRPFVQGNASVANQVGGTGLGLALCRQFVQLMGGRIEVESEEGAGSLFWFEVRLPVVRGPVASPVAGLERIRVLVLGPAPDELCSLENAVRRLGVPCLTASGEQEGCELLQAELDQGRPVDAVILVEGEDLNPAAVAVRLAERLCPAPAVLTVARHAAELGELAGAGLVTLQRPIRSSKLHKALLQVLGRQEEPAAADGESAPLPAAGMRVLVVDDNVVNRKVVGKMLERFGAGADFAVNGLEGSELAAAADYDLVFMDMQMPVMDGLEATRRIRALDGPRARVPVVALTANVLAEARQAAENAGLDAFLSKPIQTEELEQTLARFRRAKKVSGSSA